MLLAELLNCLSDLSIDQVQGRGWLYWTNSSNIIRWQVVTERQIFSHQVKVPHTM